MSYSSYSYGSTSYGGSLSISPVLDGKTKIRPKVLLRYGRINEPIRVPIYDLLVDAEPSYLIDDVSSGSTSFSIKNVSSFEANQIYLIGEEGNENSEIVKSIVTPTGNTITITTPLKYAHNANTTIRIINYDKIEFSQADDIQDTKTVLSTINIKADNIETIFNDIYHDKGLYFARWYNSLTGLYSPYSDGVPMVSYDICMARSIIQNALMAINKDTGELLTDEYGFMEINNCVMEVIREQKRWSFMQVFDKVIGKTLQGTWKIPVPIDLDDQNTNKSIYKLRVGNDYDLTWVDKEQFDKFLQGSAYSVLKKPLVIGDASVVLVDSNDFEQSGSIVIGNTTMTYTNNDTNTGTLTLETVSLVSYPDKTDVFQQIEQGRPLYWTTHSGNIYMYPVIDANYENKTIKMDYYKKPVLIKTDTDCIPFPDPTVAQYYLEWKFLVRLNNGAETNDSEAKKAMYMNKLQKMVIKENVGRTVQLKPRINNWGRNTSFGYEAESRRERLGNYGELT